MFGKGKSVGEDWRVQPLQRSAVTEPATTPHPSETISCISSEMAVVGKIICKGVLKIYGLVEGELIAANALIADGAQIHGDIVAQELTVGGHVKGDIHALRVKLQSTAVVEGDIFHQLLSIDEHAWFEGCSRPEDHPPEPRSSIKVESSNPQLQPQASVAFDDKREFKAEFTEEEPTQLRRTGMHAFLAACIAIIAIGVMSHFALSALQQPTGLAYMTASVRIDPGWIERSTQLGAQTALKTVAPKARAAPLDAEHVPQMAQSLTVPRQAVEGWTEPLAGPESIAVQASMPETPQAAPIAQTAPETIAPKARAASLDAEHVQMAQSLAAPRQAVEQPATGRAQMAREDAELQAPDVEILGNIPVPRPRPTAAPARKPMPVRPPSSLAPTPFWTRLAPHR